MPQPPSRRAGRPAGSASASGEPESAVRGRLLGVAQRLFAERGYHAVSVRELAREAHVSPGMIAYYFGGKAGLFDAVVDSVFEPLLAQVKRLDLGGGGDAFAPERLVRLYVETIGRVPWLPAFLVREVLGGDAERRARFTERFPARAASVVLPFLQHEKVRGHLRADLDPALAVLSLIGMCAFPFLVHPLLGPVLGYQLDDAFRERLAEHSVRLFLDGTRGEAK